MEATAIAGLEWACLHEWAARVGAHRDWIQWMYARVGALTEVIMEQRKEWHDLGEEHPYVVKLSEERRDFFRHNGVIAPPPSTSDLERQFGVEYKRRRVFKNGIF